MPPNQHHRAGVAGQWTLAGQRRRLSGRPDRVAEAPGLQLQSKQVTVPRARLNADRLIARNAGADPHISAIEKRLHSLSNECDS